MNAEPLIQRDDNPLWGKPGHNVHIATWAPDRHTDETSDQ